MTEQQEKILKVLDMSENEQLFFLNNLWQNRKLPDWFSLRPDVNGKITMTAGNRQLLADLAFFKRDEAVAKNHADFHEAIYDVMMKVEGVEKWATAFWGECIAKPIHWILAAEMIKAKDKDNDNN